MLRILILDAYDDEGRRSLARVGATEAGALYERMLQKIEPSLKVERARFGAGGFDLPAGASLGDYDGIAWTGSNLTVHRSTPAVRDQLDLVRAAFAAGVPSFGSCWAIHLAVTAAGGRCEPNPRGREFGVARKVLLETAGREHPLYEGKPRVFDAFASHEDHVVEIGVGTEILAGNDFSAVQAAIVRQGAGELWAVQYHPEYEPRDIADLGALRAPQLIEQGFFRGPDDARAYVDDLRALSDRATQKQVAFRLGVGADLLDPAVRTREARNWVDRLVKPVCAQRR
jgi:GMP synthase (glutamine-hydrolysing)